MILISYNEFYQGGFVALVIIIPYLYNYTILFSAEP